MSAYGRITNALTAGGLLILVGGCGGPERNSDWPQTFPVTGVVRLNNEPLEGATVMFSPTTHRFLARGTTNAEGVFTLVTPFSRSIEDEGAAAGNYKVLITKTLPEDEWDVPEKTGDEVADMKAAYAVKDPQAFLETPAEYGDVMRTPLTADVTTEDNEFLFEMSKPQ